MINDRVHVKLKPTRKRVFHRAAEILGYRRVVVIVYNSLRTKGKALFPCEMENDDEATNSE